VRTWLITDTHFGHTNIRRFCNRPENCEDKIYSGLRDVLQREDLLIHLGDVAWGQVEKAWHANLMLLPGKKWLLKGNHDHRSVSWYLSRGWDAAAEIIMLEEFGELIAFSHYPLPYVAGKAWYTLNIHGHCHLGVPDYAALGDENGSHHRLLALEIDGYRPLHLQSVVEKKRRG
jgi:calcineurin-like phosphoesterase family protein